MPLPLPWTAWTTAAWMAAGAEVLCPVVEDVRVAPDLPTPVEVQVGVTPGATEHALHADTTARLEATLDRITAQTGAQSVGAAVIVPGFGRWSATRGADDHDLFSVGSIGKAATAALVLQASHEGRLSLADPVSRWFPRVIQAEAHTIDQLLTHHSGYVSFNALPPLIGRLPSERPRQLVRFATRRSGEACPSNAFSYSNTNYVLLGLILEDEYEHLLHEQMLTHILHPLGLSRSRAMHRAMPPPELLDGHDPDGTRVTSIDYGAPHGAGNLAMTAHDLATFWHALLVGQVIDTELVDLMLDGWSRMPAPEGTPAMYYGRGVMLIEAPTEDGWLVGHLGGIRGFSAIVAWSTHHEAIVAVTLSGGQAAEAAAWALLSALEPPTEDTHPETP